MRWRLPTICRTAYEACFSSAPLVTTVRLLASLGTLPDYRLWDWSGLEYLSHQGGHDTSDPLGGSSALPDLRGMCCTACTVQASQHSPAGQGIPPQNVARAHSWT